MRPEVLLLVLPELQEVSVMLEAREVPAVTVAVMLEAPVVLEVALMLGAPGVVVLAVVPVLLGRLEALLVLVRLTHSEELGLETMAKTRRSLKPLQPRT
jgi:hypothetical protein